MNSQNDSLLRRADVCKKLGIKTSTLDNRIADGLVPHGIQASSRMCCWLESEINQLIHLIAAELPPDEIRQRVKAMIENRKSLAA